MELGWGPKELAGEPVELLVGSAFSARGILTPGFVYSSGPVFAYYYCLERL